MNYDEMLKNASPKDIEEAKKTRDISNKIVEEFMSKGYTPLETLTSLSSALIRASAYAGMSAEKFSELLDYYKVVGTKFINGVNEITEKQELKAHRIIAGDIPKRSR